MGITYEYSFIFTTLWFVMLAIMTAYYTTKPRYIVMPYIVTLLVFTGTLYGVLDADLTIYSRGSGVLLVPFIYIFLFLLFVVVFIRYGARYKKVGEPVVQNAALSLLCLIIALYYVYGAAVGISFENMLSRYGMINLINLYLLYLIMKWWIYDEKQLDNFIKVFVFVTFFMALYGLFRWALFGGDPANFYLNVGGQSVRITYFDGGQGLLFGVFFVILYNKTRLGLVSGSVKWFYYFMMAASLLNMLLSFRRTIWLGILFVFIWIFLTSKASRKMLILGLALVVLMIGSGVYQQRFDESHKGLGSDITDKSGKVDLKHGRFSEIARALKVANQHFITGLGPWGINSPRVTSWKDNDFVHSSIIHTYIKTGAFGGLLYLSIFIGYGVWWLKKRKRRWQNDYYRSLGDAFFCGFLMEVPDIVFGTPLIIFRHTQILAIMLVMPYLCYKIDRMTTTEEPVKSKQSSRLLHYQD